MGSVEEGGFDPAGSWSLPTSGVEGRRSGQEEDNPGRFEIVAFGKKRDRKELKLMSQPTNGEGLPCRRTFEPSSLEDFLVNVTHVLGAEVQ